jgi:hypothetical protein
MGGLDPKNSSVAVPSYMIPGFRTQVALERKTEKNLLIVAWGGLGDQVCCEPTVRHALEYFKGVDISLATHIPEVFRHLPLKNVFKLEHDKFDDSEYLTFHCIPQNNDLAWQFINHNITNCVDFPALGAFRSMLPIASKSVKLFAEPILLPRDLSVVVHPGKHWPSKTFPKSFWDAVLAGLRGHGITPIIVGKNMGADDNRSTVDVDPMGCVDLRDKLDINGLTYLLQNSKVILTNDSCPIHIGASGSAFIGFVATCKHPDFISHWRNGVWSWRMTNLGRGGIWETIDHLPNKPTEIVVDKCTPEQMNAWLPKPETMVEWALNARKVYNESLA